MDNLQEKIGKLPTWAREHIKRLEIGLEPAVEQAAKARRERDVAVSQSKRLSEANEALLELLRGAGKSGIDWAKVVVETLEGYEIFKPSAPHTDQWTPEEIMRQEG